LFEDFLRCFEDKIDAIRPSIVPSTDDPVDLLIPTRFFNTFESISLLHLMDSVAKLKPTTSALDIVPTQFF